MEYNKIIHDTVEKSDKTVAKLLAQEEFRQKSGIELIASENYPSEAVMAACGSIFTAKYTEGYPGSRYYGGCQYYDELERYCQAQWQKVFKTDYHVNVQPHSGSSANLAAYMAVIKPGDTILSMDLNQGGHLTHGSRVNFSGKLYNIIHYKLDESGRIDVEDIKNKVAFYSPALVLVGASAYSRTIDFAAIKNAIDGVAAEIGNYHPYFMVDMAHIAGLIAAEEHPTPFGIADIITTTTHKTLRGPRGGLIFCKPELARKIDSAVFPGTQGGSLQNIIAAKAIAATEALTPQYKTYIQQVIKNTKAMADTFAKLGYEIVSGGTDNHLFMIDFSRTHPNLSGKMVQEALDAVGITLNKNCVPNEQRKPQLASGVRIGAAAMTTLGWTETDFVKTAFLIDKIIKDIKID